MSARLPITSNTAARFEAHAEPAVMPHMASPRRPHAAPSEVWIAIERLRIEGLNLTSRQGAHVQGAVERELARLLQAQPLQLRGGAIAGLRAPSFSATLGTDPDALGTAIARSLFAAMRKEISEYGQ